MSQIISVQLKMSKLAVIALIFTFVSLTVTNPAFAEQVDWSTATIIDVRTLEEWNQGHIEGALWIPWESISKDIPKHDINKDKPLGFYCAAGVRSERAIRTLIKLGYSQTYNLINTRTAAKISGREIVKPPN